MTPIEYHFIAPNGDPIANTDVEFILLEPTFDPQEPGILLPRVVVVTTNEFGKGVVNLASVDVQYQVVIYDLRSDAALSYKFYVPDPTPGLTFRLQDLIVAGPISTTTYDEAAILAIQNAKVNAMAAAASAEASKVAAMGYATTASNTVGDVIAAKDAAILSKDAAAVSAAEAVTSKNVAIAKALEASNKATEALGHATLAETRANSAATNATSAAGSAAIALTKAAEAEASKDAAVSASNTAVAAQGVASTKATEAAASVVAAAASANVASTKEAQALAAANAANSSFNGATDAANLATSKASAAALSATGATNSAGTATTKATESAASAVVASNKASEAAASAVLATSRIDEAAASATLAQNSATLSGTKATESSGSATASAASANLSLTREQKAKQWAEEELGVAVEPGKFSAKHWANQAQASATGAMVYRGAFSAAGNAYPLSPSLGDYYVISVGGTLPGMGSVSPTDSIIYNGTSWDKIDSTDSVTSVAGRVGSVTLTKADVGLSLVDNTADANKPVSAAQLAALDSKAPIASPAFIGMATLNGRAFAFPPVKEDVLTTAVNCVSDVEYRFLNAGATTATLPSAPEVDDNVSWVSDNGRTDNVIARNGQLINGIADNVILDVSSGSLRFVGGTLGWVPSEDRFRSSGATNTGGGTATGGTGGDTIVVGIKGDKGDTGDQGIQGIPGLKGDKGDPGTDGTKGTNGAKGDKGDKGDTGEPGTTTWAGITDKPMSFITAAHTHEMSEITGLLAALDGKAAVGSGGGGGTGTNGREVELQKTATHIQWRYVGDLTWTNLVLLSELKGADSTVAGPKGDTGAKGDTGLTGLTGDTGLKGDKGEPGIKGDSGLTGLTGLKGDKGDQGIPGSTSWVGITDKPSSFTPAAHPHTAANITDFDSAARSAIAAETIFVLTGNTPAITPANGTIQTWTLAANSTPTLGTWAEGTGLTLMLTAGAFAVTWPAITWTTADGNAPTPKTTGVTIIVLWKVGSTVYGK